MSPSAPDDATQWVRVSIFKDLAEKLSAHLPKGSKVYCEGTLRLSHWTDKRTGEDKSGLQLAC
jgi:single-stranded DNA-binding protein